MANEISCDILPVLMSIAICKGHLLPEHLESTSLQFVTVKNIDSDLVISDYL